MTAPMTVELSRRDSDDENVCLLLGDADAIKGYVYETNSLPEIRGASQIIQEFEQELKDRLKGRLIFCGGGGFLAAVPADQVGRHKREIEDLYLERTLTATITIAASNPLKSADLNLGLPPHGDAQVKNLSGTGVAADLIYSHFEALLGNRAKRKNFGELVAKLTSQLRQEKRKKENAPFFEALPVYSRCVSCGKRAAVKFDTATDEWICVVCNRKRMSGRQQRRTFVERFMKWVKCRKHVDIGLPGYPKNLDELADAEGRIALLYADGNNMGDVLQIAPSQELYMKFSEALECATEDALFSAFWEVFGEDRITDRGKPLPFEIIALGGDDVVVTVPSSYGWDLALRLLEGFECHPKIKEIEEKIKEALRDASAEPARLSLSAGLAIADVKYPVRFLFNLANGLLKEAKRLARQLKTGTLCHLWLRAPIISEDAKSLLNELYGREHCHLTARPFDREGAEQLTEVAKKLKSRLPASQLKALAEALEKGVRFSLNYALYQAARMAEGDREIVLSALKELGSLSAGAFPRGAPNQFWFWHQGVDEQWKTALLDAIELIELMPKYTS